MSTVNKVHPVAIGREQGVSLIELLIGLAVGAIIAAGALTVFAKINFSGIENVRMVRLNEQLRSTLDVIHRDLQRAGYVNAWQAGDTTIADLDFAAMNDFGTITLGGTCADGDGDGADECDCITYNYDFDKDGALHLGGEETFGFRLNANAVERDTVSATCAGGAGWQDATDGEVTISALSFELDPGSTIVEVGNGNDDGICEAGETCLARRKINVVLEGELSADSDFTVRMRDEIKVRNDHYYTMP
ncbi:MAG: prepilin-type N-terminal cleavage/methylation domain-containing protein [Gammaproteobacteria bacterium]|nr:prepilin-type N-terminal cleavage/methylation domain-containing protein [Gammaproteobacteria bacterium]MBQ0840931.1 prepilin-type N-terminal cleavage/methylation domain-containing protein [Gammaproteobacteria bacterium]